MREDLIFGTLSLILIGVIAFHIQRLIESRKHRKTEEREPPHVTIL